MSDNSKFKITTKVRKALIDNAEIYSIVGEQIFPITAPKDTKGDFIIYQRDEYSKEWTKMGVASESCKVYINAISADYKQSQEMAYQINEALEGTHTDSGMDIRLVDSTEDFEDSKYIQVLLFEIK